MDSPNIADAFLFAEFRRAVLRALPRDIDADIALGWIQHGELLAQILREALASCILLPGKTYPVFVDYETQVENEVMSGGFDWANRDINSRNFPSRRKGSAEIAIQLINFRSQRSISTNDVLRKLDESGMRPAEILELLALGKRYPELIEKGPIVSLGSVWSSRPGDFYSPYLDGDRRRRYLYLIWFDRYWDESYQFAAVNKR
jgi:hypothetical protein